MSLIKKKVKSIYMAGFYPAKIQLAVLISKSKGLSETLRDIRISTYQICRIEQNTNRTTKFTNEHVIRLLYMLKILWKRGKIAPQEQFLLFSTIFCYLMLDFYVKTRTRFSLRDKRLFEITKMEITRVECSFTRLACCAYLHSLSRSFLFISVIWY